MSDRQVIQRVADEHVAFFTGHGEHDLPSFVAQHWAPHIRITNGASDAPVPLDRWLRAHSAEGGFDWDDTGLEVTNVIVGDDSFAIQTVITPSISGTSGFSTELVPACLVFTVSGGQVIELEEYVDASSVTMPDKFASQLLSERRGRKS
jgi:hypothetical protein